MVNVLKKLALLMGLLSLFAHSDAQWHILPPPYLLQPTGKYGIGYQDISLTNPRLCPDYFYEHGLTTEDYSAENHQHCHEIMLRVYYPSMGGPQLGDDYDKPVIDDFIMDLTHHAIVTDQDIPSLAALYSLKTYTRQSIAPVSQKTFPVIFFIPGAGVQSQNYSNLISELVSHGYIIIAMNSVHIAGSLTLDNGHVVQGYPHYDEHVRLEEFSDLQYTLQTLTHIPFDRRLKKMMNFEQMGFLGHSMGAMNIIYYLQQHSPLTPIKAAVFLDPGNVLGQKNYPIALKHYSSMILWSSYFRAHMNGSMNPKEGDQEIVLTPNSQDINFSNHFNLTDYSTLQYHPVLANKSIQSYLTEASHVNLGQGDGYFLATTINQYVLAYFDRYLIHS